MSLLPRPATQRYLFQLDRLPLVCCDEALHLAQHRFRRLHFQFDVAVAIFARKDHDFASSAASALPSDCGTRRRTRCTGSSVILSSISSSSLSRPMPFRGGNVHHAVGSRAGSRASSPAASPPCSSREVAACPATPVRAAPLPPAPAARRRWDWSRRTRAAAAKRAAPLPGWRGRRKPACAADYG